MLEVAVTGLLEWRPPAAATVAGRTVTVVQTGTTRPGPIAAGSLLRVELDAAADDIRRADGIEIRCGDRVLIVTLGSVA
jgi:hypothetical protein